MTRKKYVYSKEKNTPRSRVNVWQLQQKLNEQTRHILLLQRAISHQAGVNAQQVLLNESLSDRIELLEKAQWKREQSIFQRFARWFRK
ncbi:TPA: hypothetical protein ACPI87_000058 [Haemophilus influenzae]|uniref:hypothetical protein n=1 Tax=Haemophilus influenzae TaxID=727 RepID=UPI000D003D65|nr:hypothetical protein [Haemophilus influenzae]PRI37855.1 hypothetical protein BVZ56_00407 [Haemophilus influenzae]PRJ54710.1 hypothetical protein BV094_00170 [Haemophilus influenzae]PRJ59639.1 hypothetical protein BV097_00951 [Haemophilus influenzae]